MSATSWLRLAELGQIAEAIWPEVGDCIIARSAAVLRVLAIVNGERQRRHARGGREGPRAGRRRGRSSRRGPPMSTTLLFSCHGRRPPAGSAPKTERFARGWGDIALEILWYQNRRKVGAA